MMAFDALTARSYIHAFTLFNEALEQTISTPQLEAEALNMRATFRFIMGDAKLALIDLDRSTSIWPQGVQSYVKKASVHMELGMATEAFHDFEAALQIDPNDPDVFYHRGQVYFITGSYPLAIEEYRQSSVLDPTFIFSHIQLAVALYKQGDVAGALDNFETLLAQHPTSGEVANYYGELLLDQGKFEKAIQMFELSIELNSESCVFLSRFLLHFLVLIAALMSRQSVYRATYSRSSTTRSRCFSGSKISPRPKCSVVARSKSIPSATSELLRSHNCYCNRIR